MKRHLFRIAVVLCVAGLPAFAQNEVPVGTIEGRIVEGTSLIGVEGATVVVTDAEHGPVVASGTTNADGRFGYKVPPGKYDILAIFGDARWIHLAIKVERGKVTQVPGALNLDAEIVTVHDKAPKEHRAPAVVRSTVKNILPYSDEAIDKNIWAVGWMLLDVDQEGVVTGFRFLHRPSYGLDAIAEKEIWGLRFQPAVDADGKTMVSKVLWKLEWPAFHWAQDHKLLGTGGEGATQSAMVDAARNDAGLSSHFPTGLELHALEVSRHVEPTVNGSGGIDLRSEVGSVLRGSLGVGSFVLPDGVHKPPCRGSGPLALDEHEPLYRDCTPPTLGNVNEATIRRPPQ